MSGFCGWIGTGAASADPRGTLEKMATRLCPTATVTRKLIVGPGAAAAVVSQTTATELAEDDVSCAAVCGRPRFDDSDLQELADRSGVACSVLEAYRRHGGDFVHRLRGGYSLAVLEKRRPEGVLAVDLIGGRFPLVYSSRDDCLLFASHAAAIRCHPLGGSDTDLQALYNYLYFRVVPGPRTAFRDIRRLLPGRVLHFSNGLIRIEKHSEVRFVDCAPTPLEELEEDFRQILQRSVKRCADGSELGCFLSGGTDSSAVAGLAGEVTGRPARTFSVGFSEKRYDETGYARLAAEHFNTQHEDYFITPEDLQQLIPTIASAYSDPMGNESAVAAYYCAKKAAGEGIEKMLAGDGGDELFAGNSRYLQQRVFDAYRYVPSSVRRWLLEPLILLFPGGDRVLPVRKMRSYIRRANLPLPDRLESYNHLEMHGVEDVLEPEFLGEVDVGEPLRLMREIYGDAQTTAQLNRMLALDFRLTLADNDLPKVSRMCELAGVEVEYPLLDDELIFFSARVPVRYKLKPGKLRWFWKYALRRFLPAEILNKPKHGMGVPFGLWINPGEPLRETVLDTMQSFRRRGLVQPTFIDRLFELHRTVHPIFYGSMIWSLVQLEHWFQAHIDGQ